MAMRVKACGVRLYKVFVERIRTQSTADDSGQYFPCPILVSFRTGFSGKSCPVSVHCPNSVCLGSVSCPNLEKKKMLHGVCLDFFCLDFVGILSRFLKNGCELSVCSAETEVSGLLVSLSTDACLESELQMCDSL